MPTKPTSPTVLCSTDSAGALNAEWKRLNDSDCRDWYQWACLANQAIAAAEAPAGDAGLLREPVAWIDRDDLAALQVQQDDPDSDQLFYPPVSRWKTVPGDVPLYTLAPKDSGASTQASNAAPKSLSVEALVALLKAARCPDENCDGKGTSWHVVMGGNGEAEQEQIQCQWCYERDAAMADKGAGS